MMGNVVTFFDKSLSETSCWLLEDTNKNILLYTVSNLISDPT